MPFLTDNIAASLFEKPREISKSEIEGEIYQLLFTVSICALSSELFTPVNVTSISKCCAPTQYLPPTEACFKMQALGVNRTELIVKAQKLKKKIGPEPPLPSENHDAAMRLKFLKEHLPSVDVIDIEPQDPRTKLLQNLKVLRCLVGDAVLDQEQDQEQEETEEDADNAMDLRTSRKRKASLDSQEYRMAPLPPMCSSLYAFKTLLLQRASLLQMAHSYHEPGTIDHSLRAHPDSVIIRRKVTPEDITPSQLPAVPVQDILQARQLVRECTVTSVVQRPRSRIAKITETHNYQKLRSRFISAFLWPAMLSAIPPPGPPAPQQPPKKKPKVTYV
jgi:hypothetical protein